MAETSRPPLSLAMPRRRALPRVAWVLVVSAFLCGALVSGAVFASVWRHQAQKSDSAATALAAEQQHSHSLAASLVAAQTARSRALLEVRGTQTSARKLTRRIGALQRRLAAAGHAASTASVAATGFAGELGKLTSELRTLTSYLRSTPPDQLDSAYVQAQTDYLTRAIGRVGSESASLQIAATAYARTVGASH
jgi:hypothetical protein